MFGGGGLNGEISLRSMPNNKIKFISGGGLGNKAITYFNNSLNKLIATNQDQRDIEEID